MLCFFLRKVCYLCTKAFRQLYILDGEELSMPEVSALGVKDFHAASASFFHHSSLVLRCLLKTGEFTRFSCLLFFCLFTHMVSLVGEYASSIVLDLKRGQTTLPTMHRRPKPGHESQLRSPP